MTKFLKLTSHPNRNLTLVQIDHIVAIEKNNSGANIHCVFEISVTVSESVATIEAMIRNEEVVK